MENMKFRVESPEKSKEIQTELFRLGFNHGHGVTPVYLFLRKPFLFCNFTTKKIFWDDEKETFNLADTYAETTLEELKAM